MPLAIDDMAAFCKRKGLVYPNSEVYGGVAGVFDYGPFGVELKNNLINAWWHRHVTTREDVIGLDSAILSNAKVWEASGHTTEFTDYMLVASKTNESVRADQLIEEKVKIPTDGLTADQLLQTAKKHRLKSPSGAVYDQIEKFNLLFPVKMGVGKGNETFLRGETAQLIFTNFKLAMENGRMKMPFGIAQTGKAFRNEISPRGFLFRCREFEQMEIEYFINPLEPDCPYVKDVEKLKLNVLSATMQLNNARPQTFVVKDLVAKNIMTPWHAYWLTTELKWFTDLGCDPGKFRVRQHQKNELAHYSKDCWDLEYQFPFGWKELLGIADRGDFDLQQHMKHAKTDFSVFIEQYKQKVVPHVVAEPSLGVGRSMLVFLYEAYDDDKKRGNIVLHLHPKLSPIKVAVLPLVKKLSPQAKKVYDDLKEEFACFFDESGTVGRRYARMDEIGTPYCVTLDFDSGKGRDVTIRDRDSTKQKRVKISKLKEMLRGLIAGDVKFRTLK